MKVKQHKEHILISTKLTFVDTCILSVNSWNFMKILCKHFTIHTIYLDLDNTTQDSELLCVTGQIQIKARLFSR